MLEVTSHMVEATATEIRRYLAKWKTPADFEDYCENDLCVVMLETIADGSWGREIPQRVAVWLEIQLTKEEMEHDGGWCGVECDGQKVMNKLNAQLPDDIPGYVCLGFVDGDYGVVYVVPVDDLNYPEDK